MRVPAGPSFDEERQRFALRFTCEHCAHFSPPRERKPAECRHGWPTAPHRLEAARDASEILFCKEFELC